jgi:hypothetical protein
VWHYPVLSTTYKVLHAELIGATFAWGFQIFAALHGKKVHKDGKLVISNQPWYLTWSVRHLLEQFEWDRFFAVAWMGRGWRILTFGAVEGPKFSHLSQAMDEVCLLLGRPSKHL